MTRLVHRGSGAQEETPVLSQDPRGPFVKVTRRNFLGVRYSWKEYSVSEGPWARRVRTTHGERRWVQSSSNSSTPPAGNSGSDVTQKDSILFVGVTVFPLYT